MVTSQQSNNVLVTPFNLPMGNSVLVGDIGGTNARFALADGKTAHYHSERVYTCREFATPLIAIRTYLKEVNSDIPPRICLAVAGPVTNGDVTLTNNNWTLNAKQLMSSLGTSEVRLLNDFEAVAHCIPALTNQACLKIGTPSPSILETEYNFAVIGPGTGLGVATLTSVNGQIQALATEGGHIGFAAESEQQQHVLSRLASRFGRVSTERLVSGQGIENLYWALSNDPNTAKMLSAAEIFENIHSDELAQQTITLFFRILGQVAGDIALATGAFNGVYLAGGIAQRYPKLLEASDFRAGFEDKGRHTRLMQSIPTMLIIHPQPGLLGATVASDL